METAKTFTRLIETNSPLGNFYVKIEIDKHQFEIIEGVSIEDQPSVGVSSYDDLKGEPVIVTKCANSLDEIMKTVQEVSQSHSVYLMEKEREDVTKFLINRGFKPEYPRIIS